jgi:hypothetical protein
MPAYAQQLVWTALPAGLSSSGGRLVLAAMVSPRLRVSPGPDDVLAAFPDMLAWPAIVRAASFEVELGGVTVPAEVVSDPDEGVHARLFFADTAVVSHAFEDRRGSHVLSYPLAGVEADLRHTYGQLAVEADGELPLLDDMRDRFRVLGRGLRAYRDRELLDDVRRGVGAAAGETPTHRLALANLYHTPLSAPETGTYVQQGPDDPREDVSWRSHALATLPAPDSFRQTFEFHAIVAALAEYPALLRATGLVVDLEVDRAGLPPGGVEGPLIVTPRWESVQETVNTGVDVLPDVAPRTLARLDDEGFSALSRTPQDPPARAGFVRVGVPGFDVLQADVNGSALKLHQFAISMFQVPAGQGPDELTVPDPVGVPAARTGAPALRSGGLTLAMGNRGAELEGRFDRSGQMQDAMDANAPIDLHLEDLVRGYRVEIRDTDAAEWRSLCRRDTQFTFRSDLAQIEVGDNEGTLRLVASGSADGSNPDIVKLYEGLFTWAGWSLAAPHVVRTIAIDDSVTANDGGVAPDGLPLDVEHRVRRRSLPSLRYGRSYSVRLRLVDLGGAALPFDPDRQSPPETETEPVEYLRFEPLGAPTFALVGPAATVAFPGPGEDLTTLVIRSLNARPEDADVPTDERAQRHVVPPLSSVQHAECHGALDDGDGRIDAAHYQLLVARDGVLAEVADPVTEKSFPIAGPGRPLPFLPDPLALHVAVRIDGRTAPDSVETLTVPWYPDGETWPDAAMLRVRIFEHDDGAAAPVEWDDDARVLRVPLAKADWVRLRMSHELSDDELDLMGIWRWAADHLPDDPAERERLAELARSGRHWMLTPWHDLELVHAVQKPLVEPVLERLAVHRTTGRTIADVALASPIDSRSTEKVDLFGRWRDPVDDPAEPAPRASVNGGQRAAELLLERLEAPGVDPPGWLERRAVPHDYGDTRYRRVAYWLTATTRFTRFLPAALQAPARAQELTVTSAEEIAYVPNSAPPPAPDVVYVIPTFGWSRDRDEGGARSWRAGGGLRVYLRRPWLVSGYMEMLAVVLPRAGEASATQRLAPFVTRWGEDPTWNAADLVTPAPELERFTLAVTDGPIPAEDLDPVIPEDEGELPDAAFQVAGLALPGVPEEVLVDVAPHLVGWDPERRLWYADIVVDPGDSYAPFLRMALARYQPISAHGSHLSAVASAEVVQVLPDRLAVVTRGDDLVFRVGLYGALPAGRNREVEFELERLAPDAATDLGWEPLEDVRVDEVATATHGAPPETEPPDDDLQAEAEQLLQERRFDELVRRPELIERVRPPLIEEVELELPREPEPGERFRLVITEAEVRGVDAHHPRPASGHDPRERVIYLEVVGFG